MMLTRKQQEEFMSEAPKRRVERIKRWGGDIKPSGLYNLLTEEQRLSALNMPDHVIGKPPLTNAALDAEFDAWIWPGRDNSGLRFGQFLMIHYSGVPEQVFSCENTATVYVALCEYLSEHR